jgi:hypothetical protein
LVRFVFFDQLIRPTQAVGSCSSQNKYEKMREMGLCGYPATGPLHILQSGAEAAQKSIGSANCY